MNYSEQLNKVMDSTFNYKGILVTRLIGGFEALGQKFLTLEKIDEYIKEKDFGKGLIGGTVGKKSDEL